METKRQEEVAKAMGVVMNAPLSDSIRKVKANDLVARHAGKIAFVAADFAKTNTLGGRWVRDEVVCVNTGVFEGKKCLIISEKSGITYILREDGHYAKVLQGCKKAKWTLSDVNNSGRVGIKPVVGKSLTSISMERVMLLAYSKMLGILPEDIDAVEVNCMDLGGTRKTLEDERVIDRNFKIDNLEFCLRGKGSFNSNHKTYWYKFLEDFGVCTRFSIYDAGLYKAIAQNGTGALRAYAMAHRVQ